VAADGLLPLLQLAAAAHGPARNHAVRALRHVGAMDARYAAALHTLLGQVNPTQALVNLLRCVLTLLRRLLILLRRLLTYSGVC
jgi:hypothetical protein